MTKKERKTAEDRFRQGTEYATRTVTGFMCKVDFDHELGCAAGGNRVYPTMWDPEKNRECVRGREACCGIVEVEVRLKRIVVGDSW